MQGDCGASDESIGVSSRADREDMPLGQLEEEDVTATHFREGALKPAEQLLPNACVWTC